ncbi:CPBP family intramembrane metalloprotease [Permianibacter sp. IMCC34836]|uniref:CPBP family intramembrane glutamic endopeptidase n=1 Tax=Permianibacter fluminis TaxID=2738515 RepID=UPI001555FB56|nr:CPBP family intramembrane glutamic endopeptidase [Permianibacter fluminis]NQD37735.1 CPBP family intramembrane metalloprotease [Permianibacter fluminis]
MKAFPLGAFVAVICAVLVTGALVLIGQSGLTSVLPLAVIMAVCWGLTRYSRREIGFRWGTQRGLALAIAHPLLVLGVLTGLALLVGERQASEQTGMAVAVNLAVIFLLTFVLGLITEEGFFRGWLWANLKRAGASDVAVIVLTSVAFSLWHAPEVLFSPEFSLPPLQAVILLSNAVVIGCIWGLLRAISGSLVLTSLCHGLWNAGAYVLFGDGASPGALGLTDTRWFGPEHGALGLLLNVAVLALLWRAWQSSWRKDAIAQEA